MELELWIPSGFIDWLRNLGEINIWFIINKQMFANSRQEKSRKIGNQLKVNYKLKWSEFKQKQIYSIFFNDSYFKYLRHIFK